MSETIFLLDKNNKLVKMYQEDYDSEDLIQKLLEDFPTLLPGDQINNIEPRKWLLISREMSVPDTSENNSRWSLDHLFLDQDGIPTLVEVKRSSDTRIRREVIGQMMEYASNAVMYWGVDTIRTTYEIRCENSKLNPETFLIDTLELEQEIGYDEFWSKVEDNLKLSRLRLIFLADKISNELRRIIEFLNEQMNPTEVLGVEIKQFVNKDQKTLVPTVIGQTIRNQNTKSQYPKSVRQWNRDSFLEEIEKREGEEIKNLIIKIIDWCEKQNLRLWWGKGKVNGSFFPMLNINNVEFWTFAVWTYGTIEIEFQYIRTQNKFSDKKDRLKLLEEFNKIEGVKLSEDSIEKRPSLPFSLLLENNSLFKFFKIWEEYIAKIKKG